MAYKQHTGKIEIPYKRSQNVKIDFPITAVSAIFKRRHDKQMLRRKHTWMLFMLSSLRVGSSDLSWFKLRLTFVQLGGSALKGLHGSHFACPKRQHHRAMHRITACTENTIKSCYAQLIRRYTTLMQPVSRRSTIRANNKINN